jgi:PAS domain S-box-containing protein
MSAAGGPLTPPVTLSRLSLREKTLLIVCFTIFGLVAGLYMVSRLVILRSFARLEARYTREDLGRAYSGLYNELAALDRNNKDYSCWNQTYAFVQGQLASYPQSEFPTSTFMQLDIDVVSISDTDDKVLFAAEFDRKQGIEVAISPEIRAKLDSIPTLARASVPSEESISGIIMTAEGPMLIDSQPVHTSAGTGPAKGTMVMGRRLNESEVRAIAETIHLPLTVVALKDFANSQDRATVEALMSRESPAVVRPTGDSVVEAYRLVNDIWGQPALVLKLTIPRAIYMQGQSSQTIFLLWLTGAGLLFGALTIILLERMVLARVAALQSSVAWIAASGDLSARLVPAADDELADLEREINRMLGAVENSQAERHEREARLRLLVERMPAILWTTDANLRFTSSLGAGLEAFDLEPNQLTGMALSEYYQTNRQDPPIEPHLRALRGERSTFQFDWKGRSLETHVEPLRGSDGSIQGVIGVSLDVTEQLRAQRALERTEMSYRNLIEEAPYGICRVTDEGELLLVNRALAEMLGYASNEELRGRNMMTDICEKPEDHARLLELLREKDHIQGAEVQWRRKDGGSLNVRLGGRVDSDETGRLYYEVLAENVTERIQFESQLQQIQKMQAVGQLAGGIAHDFNNLLMVMRGHIEILSTRVAPGADIPARNNLDQLDRATQRAAMLTRQLLAFSRQQVLQSRVLDVNRVIAEMIEMVPRLIGENIEVSFRPGQRLWSVKADAGQLEQALLNLTVNARDAMPGGGRITIETSNLVVDDTYIRRRPVVPPGRYVVLTVSDTGCGIPQGIQSRIFEPFFTTKEKGKGTGLGLAMVYGIVKQSGGYVWVYSEEGQGAAFKIYLPAVEQPIESSEPAASPLEKLEGSETILLVEDETSVRELISQYLRDMGHTVAEASDGAEALEVARRHQGPVHMLVTDMVMPKMSGRELADRLLVLNPQLKVLFISGYTSDSAARHGILEGEMAFLQKPFGLRDLARKIREVLNTSRDVVPAGTRPN